MDNKLKNTLVVFLVIVLAVFLVILIYTGSKTDNNLPEQISNPTNTDNTVISPEDNSPEPLPMIEVYFNETLAIEPQGLKSPIINNILLPILKGIYDKPGTDGQIVSGVKLKESSNDNKLIYVFSSITTQAQINSFKSAAIAVGSEIISEDGAVITLKKEGLTLTFNFWLEDQTKSGVEVTF